MTFFIYIIIIYLILASCYLLIVYILVVFIVLIVSIFSLIPVIIVSKKKSKPLVKSSTKYKSDCHKNTNIERITVAKYIANSIITLEPIQSIFSFYFFILFTYFYYLPSNVLTILSLVIYNITHCQEVYNYTNY